MGCKILKRPFQGRFFWQCTKYEVSRFTRYEAMNGGAKCRKWGGLGWLVKVIGNVTIR